MFKAGTLCLLFCASLTTGDEFVASIWKVDDNKITLFKRADPAKPREPLKETTLTAADSCKVFQGCLLDTRTQKVEGGTLVPAGLKSVVFREKRDNMPTAWSERKARIDKLEASIKEYPQKAAQLEQLVKQLRQSFIEDRANWVPRARVVTDDKGLVTEIHVVHRGYWVASILRVESSKVVFSVRGEQLTAILNESDRVFKDGRTVDAGLRNRVFRNSTASAAIQIDEEGKVIGIKVESVGLNKLVVKVTDITVIKGKRSPIPERINVTFKKVVAGVPQEESTTLALAKKFEGIVQHIIRPPLPELKRPLPDTLVTPLAIGDQLIENQAKALKLLEQVDLVLDNENNIAAIHVETDLTKPK